MLEICVKERKTASGEYELLVRCSQNIVKIALKRMLQVSHDLGNVRLDDDDNWVHKYVVQVCEGDWPPGSTKDCECHAACPIRRQ
jgi:hypothetical protein